jgi:hypothetical protein
VFWLGFVGWAGVGGLGVGGVMEGNRVVWMWVGGRVGFVAGYLWGGAVGKVYFRTFGVAVQQIVVAHMLLMTFTGVSLLELLKFGGTQA